jgi:outer membrane lipoprotein carrier protein
MKKIISLALMAVTVTFSNISTSFAQDAKHVLQQISKKYNSGKGITSDFKIELIDAKGNSKMSENGNFSMKGNKYKLVIKDKNASKVANKQEIYVDGTNQWVYSVSTNEVILDKFNPNDPLNPSKLLKGNYEQDYSYHMVSHSAKKEYEITLEPKDKNNFTKVILNVDQATSVIKNGKVFQKNGSVINYNLSNTMFNVTLPDGNFKLNNPKAKVTDIR